MPSSVPASILQRSKTSWSDAAPVCTAVRAVFPDGALWQTVTCRLQPSEIIGVTVVAAAKFCFTLVQMRRPIGRSHGMERSSMNALRAAGWLLLLLAAAACSDAHSSPGTQADSRERQRLACEFRA